jgi:hypothetical protein
VSPLGLLISPQPVVYSQPFDFVGPLFSYCYELFVVPKTVNSFAIKQIRTLAQNTGGGGVSRLCALRTCPPEGGSLWQTPCSQQLTASLPSLCALFCPRFLCFQQVAASFRKTPGVGGTPSGRPAARTRWRKAPLKVQGRYIPGKVKDGEMNSPLQVDGPCHLRAEGYEH